MWKPKSDTIPISNCFQLIEKQVSKKKKKFYVLSVLPLGWTPVHEMRDQTGSRELMHLPPGKLNLLEYFYFPTVKIYFCSFISLFISMASWLKCWNLRAQGASTQCARLQDVREEGSAYLQVGVQTHPKWRCDYICQDHKTTITIKLCIWVGVSINWVSPVAQQ